MISKARDLGRDINLSSKQGVYNGIFNSGKFNYSEPRMQRSTITTGLMEAPVLCMHYWRISQLEIIGMWTRWVIKWK